jgi:hypothetical protein
VVQPVRTLKEEEGGWMARDVAGRQWGSSTGRTHAWRAAVGVALPLNQR